ncbi:MAG: sulfite:cytochrome C oxidoreductase subunit A [Epsilonproteobacteria bacterium]|nr:MAG: sulfite:cytochrome C oxidoreductase subunit A [Campylobacterota bacterium]
MHRRDFFKTSLVASAALLGTAASAGTTKQPIDSQVISTVAFPEKRPLITYSDRPPILETPRDAFTTAITPNNEFFVRWHSPKIPTHTYLKGYRISVNGLVEKNLSLSLDHLKKDYEQVEITAVLQCGGNSRSAFIPTTSGIQWGSGAMGCATWKGVRLKDILKRAGLSSDAHWINFSGADTPAFHKAPKLIRELKINEISDDMIVAYEMNGEDLPFLNGYPVRLVIPGDYSDSWIKMLSNITVTKEYKSLYYMDTAYRIPDNECECETEDDLFEKTKPITTMNIKSLIGYPTSNSIINVDANVVARGVAFDSGHGIKDVLISVNGGRTWESATLGDELSLHAFREFRFAFRLKEKGPITIMAKAINNLGEEQPYPEAIKWNHGGYKYNGIDSVTIDVV